MAKYRHQTAVGLHEQTCLNTARAINRGKTFANEESKDGLVAVDKEARQVSMHQRPGF